MSFFRIISLQLFVILNAVVLLESLQSWGNKQLFPPQNIPDGALDPQRSVVRRKVVLYHNFFRTKVRPTASNMLLMETRSPAVYSTAVRTINVEANRWVRVRRNLYCDVKRCRFQYSQLFDGTYLYSWHPGAARQAQRYAEQCRFLEHNSPMENTVPHLGACGQNLFVAAQKTPWFFAIKTWFIEYRNFTYGYPYPVLKDVGHYTQMVWATSHKVGCGVAHCPGGPWGHFYNYVCHYCPGGNYDTIIHYPYKKGEPCSDCPNNCISGALCNNPCMKRDVFSNCEELVNVTKAVCLQGTCSASCECGNARIHKNYPW